MEDSDNNETKDSLVSQLAGSFVKWGTVSDVDQRNTMAKADIEKMIESGNPKEKVVEALQSKIENMRKLIPSTTKPDAPANQAVGFYSNLITDLTAPETN